MIVYRPTDRIPLDIGPLRLIIKPLTREELQRIKTSQSFRKDEEIDYQKMLIETLRAGIEDVKIEKGEKLEYSDGSDVQIEWDSGKLSTAGLDTLSYCIPGTTLDKLSSHLIAGDVYSIAEMVVVEDKKKKYTSLKPQDQS